MDITIDITADHTQNFLNGLSFLQNHQVLIGIPEGGEKESAEASGDEKDKISNVELAFIMTYGSPLKKIPPRPFIEPALASSKAQKKIVREMGNAAKQALEGNLGSARASMEKAGMAGQSAVQESMGGTPPPNSPSTAKRKEKKHGSAVTLIDEGNLKKAITYVVEGD